MSSKHGRIAGVLAVSGDESDSTKLNIVSLYNPFEMPAGFPNWFTFADNALYTINIDRDGNGSSDLRYGFRFTTTIRTRTRSIQT